MVSPLPQETRVREVWVSPGGIAFIDFDASLPDSLGGGSLEEIQAVYGVVATVTRSFPEIRAVQILVDGEEVETLDGHVDISRPLLPQLDMVLANPRRQ
jgi:spore germination protein GerM